MKAIKSLDNVQPARDVDPGISWRTTMIGSHVDTVVLLVINVRKKIYKSFIR